MAIDGVDSSLLGRYFSLAGQEPSSTFRAPIAIGIALNASA